MPEDNSQSELNIIAEKYKDLGQDSLEIRKDFTDRMCDFSKEYRDLVIQLSVISSAIIGAIVAFGQEKLSENLFILFALILLAVCVILGLLYIKNSIEEQMDYLQKEHDEIQDKINSVREVIMGYLQTPSEDSKDKMLTTEKEIIETIKNKPKIKLVKDRVV